MRCLKAGGGILILLFALACGLRVFYPPVPRDILFLKAVSGDNELGQLIFDTRLDLFKSTWLQAVGIPDEAPPTLETLAGYISALQKNDRVDLILSGSVAADHLLAGVEHVALAVDLDNRAALFAILQRARTAHKRVLLIGASPALTHRMMKTALTELEESFSMQIPTMIWGGLALREDTEASLAPACEGTPFSTGGRTFDLGCNLLIMSRRAQVQRPALDHGLVSIEEESRDEELVAIFRPQR